jgi:hypothetical protein
MPVQAAMKGPASGIRDRNARIDNKIIESLYIRVGNIANIKQLSYYYSIIEETLMLDRFRD